MGNGRQPPGPLDTFAPGLFAGRVALVTGAGTGIGRTTALAFARYGADVVLAGRTRQTLEATAEAVAAQASERHTSAVEALVVPTDIRVTEQVDALQAAAYERFGRVDFLVNNAGGQFPALPSQISDNGWRAVVDLNLNGTWNMVSRFMGPMVAAGRGSIVNVVHIFSFDRGAPWFVALGGGAGRRRQPDALDGALPRLSRRDHQRARAGHRRDAGHARPTRWGSSATARRTGRSRPRRSGPCGGWPPPTRWPR